MGTPSASATLDPPRVRSSYPPVPVLSASTPGRTDRCARTTWSSTSPAVANGTYMDPQLKDLDDATLVAAVACSDERALQELYDRHAPAVYGLARRVLVDADRAEEVVQEVFLRLWNEPERFDPARGKLRSFLNRQAHSRAVERVRSEEARRRREERHDRENVGPTYDVEIEAWELIRSELVKDALEQLSAGERQAITLAYFGGHTYREVAVMLDLPEGTIKSRIRLGLDKLADKLEATGLGARP
jgi:RNA polymerase sigma-70 factor, ECF subfamily